MLKQVSPINVRVREFVALSFQEWVRLIKDRVAFAEAAKRLEAR
jgi:hypothetical protein